MTRSSDGPHSRLARGLNRPQRFVALARAASAVGARLAGAVAGERHRRTVRRRGTVRPVRAIPWTLHALILSGAITATRLALYFGLRDVRLPDWHDGARGVWNATARFAHRPISEANDTLAAGARRSAGPRSCGSCIWRGVWPPSAIPHRAACARAGQARSARHAVRRLLLICWLHSLAAGSDWSRRLSDGPDTIRVAARSPPSTPGSIRRPIPA